MTKEREINILFTIKRQVRSIYTDIRLRQYISPADIKRVRKMLVNTSDVINHEVQF